MSLNETELGSDTRLIVSEEKLTELVDVLLDEADFMFDDKMREELEKASLETKLNEKLDLLKKTLNMDSID
jgi:dynein regulatory complex protein 1